MPGYTTRIEHVDVCGDAWRLRVLSDNQQFADPDGRADLAGISSAQWPLFGQLWSSGRHLAEAMHARPVTGRVLELGCGLGLASLVLQRRGVEVVASDMHPLAEPFLAYNAALNDLPAVHFRHVDWTRHLATLGRFDLIIASDVMYERGHAVALADAMTGYANDDAGIVVTDPGRGNASHFLRALAERGFERHAPAAAQAGVPARMLTLSFRRGARAG